MNVAIVMGICVEHDAISAAAVARADQLAALDWVDEVVIIAQHVGRCLAHRHVIVHDAWSLVTHPDIGRADAVIFHWGIGYALFEALPLIAAERPTAVQFHNVTPPHLLSGDSANRMKGSIDQIQLPTLTGVPYWTESQFNIETLLGWGVDPQSIRFMPFPILEPPIPSQPKSVEGEVRLLTVGRLVESKGINVLVDAMAIAREHSPIRLSLTIIGNADQSDLRYSDNVAAAIERHGLSDSVKVLSDVDDEALWGAYRAAHVVVSPSLHEGLCVPVVEGYRAGCRVIGTDAGNLRFIVQPPDPIVPAGEVEPLADAIVSVVTDIAESGIEQPPGARTLIEQYGWSSTSAELAAAIIQMTRA